MPVELDATDRRILGLLCEDGRMSVRGVAERAGVSRAAAYARIERLRTSGVITGFSARLDPGRLGLQVTAHIVVTLDQHRWSGALGVFRAMPEVAYCALLAAEHDALLIVRAPNVATVRDVVLQRLQRMPEVRRTRTLLVLDELAGTDADLLAASTPPVASPARVC
ncbi:Lrp/AsnC family transcriptional regulator [Egicoccus sp. AB-alg2]|uniref:Lrp/AsnC family transcriptional regulator n=1 Tax=Egicoccus sp. AB-alg2 TaxID=3242693 RepID=UPI00359D54A8